MGEKPVGYHANLYALPFCLAKLQSKFLARTREEWERVFSDLDACVTPVLELDEAPKHPHNQHRNAFAVNCHGEMDPVSTVQAFILQCCTVLGYLQLELLCTWYYLL